jgi:hypothetical protein
MEITEWLLIYILVVIAVLITAVSITALYMLYKDILKG